MNYIGESSLFVTSHSGWGHCSKQGVVGAHDKPSGVPCPSCDGCRLWESFRFSPGGWRKKADKMEDASGTDVFARVNVVWRRQWNRFSFLWRSFYLVP